jgi:histidinol-phosphate aminotransferase
VVVIDEAYAEFAGNSALGLVTRYSNLVVLRTFSKWAGLAGLRVGYSISSSEIAEMLMTIKQPYNLNIAADVASRATIKYVDKVLHNVDLIK